MYSPFVIITLFVSEFVKVNVSPTFMDSNLDLIDSIFFCFFNRSYTTQRWKPVLRFYLNELLSMKSSEMTTRLLIGLTATPFISLKHPLSKRISTGSPKSSGCSLEIVLRCAIRSLKVKLILGLLLIVTWS